MARPTSLTPELSKKICDLHRKGLPLNRCADAVGLTYMTLWRWMKRTDAPYAEFCEAIKGARAEFQLPLIADIRAGELGWQSRAWLLERSDPKNWGRKDHVEKLLKKESADKWDKMPLAQQREELVKALNVVDAKMAEEREVH